MLQKKRNASITPDQHEIFVDLNESDEVQGYYGDILNILRDIDSYEEDRHSVHNGIGLMAVAYSRHLSSAAEDEVRDKIEDIVNAIYNDKDNATLYPIPKNYIRQHVEGWYFKQI